MNDNLLTTEEYTFCETYVGGSSRRDAYKKAYPKSVHWKITTLDPAISKLMAEPRIIQVVKFLQEEHAKNYFMSKEYKRAELKAIWEDVNNSLKDRLAAMKLDAALAGDNAPTKVENSGELNLNHSVDPKISEALDNMFGK